MIKMIHTCCFRKCGDTKPALISALADLWTHTEAEGAVSSSFAFGPERACALLPLSGHLIIHRLNTIKYRKHVQIKN